jgi:hypothetical protein
MRARAFSREIIFKAFLNDLGLGETAQLEGADHLWAPFSKIETEKAAIGY